MLLSDGHWSTYPAPIARIVQFQMFRNVDDTTERKTGKDHFSIMVVLYSSRSLRTNKLFSLRTNRHKNHMRYRWYHILPDQLS